MANFITNSKKSDLKKRLVELISKSEELKFLVGFFYFYGIENRALKQAVKRNPARFPDDFLFVLNDGEIESLVSQNVIPAKKHLGGARPFAFTGQGVARLSSVLHSEKAIAINTQIMRAFVAMRRFIASNAEVFRRLGAISKQLALDVKKYKVEKK